MSSILTVPRRLIVVAGDLLGRFFRMLFGAGLSVYRSFERWLVSGKHARYGLAVGRMVLGAVIAGSTIANLPTADYTFGGAAAWTGELQYPISSFAVMWPFSLFSAAAPNSVALHFGMFALIAAGLLYMIGYRTRLVMIPLFVLWVGFVSINSYVQDQSDNLTRIAMIALFFAAPSDVWSVDSWRRRRSAANPGRFFLVRWWRFQRVLPGWCTALAHNLAVIVLGAQLCMVYAAGGLFKDQGEPWYNGYAIYNPIHTVQFGTWPELSQFITAWGPVVGLGTVMTVLVQVSFPLLLLRRGTRIFALLSILVFHTAIAVLMGLPWFSLATIALDTIFIRDVTYRQVTDTIHDSWRTSLGRTRKKAPPAAPEIDPGAETPSVEDEDARVREPEEVLAR